jgi:hypothetical protein
MSSYQDRYDKLRSDEDAIKPINDRDGTDAERRREHYVEFNAWLVRICKDPELTDAQKVIWVFIGLHLNHKTGECFPSQTYLAIELLYTKTTIINALKAGQARGHADWPENKGRHKNQYVLFNTPKQSTQVDRSRRQQSTQVDRSSTSSDTQRSTATNPTVNGGEPNGQRPRAKQSTCVDPNYTNYEENYSNNNPALASARAAPTSEVKQANGSKQESKRTSDEASKPKDPPKLEEVKGQIAYVSVADHEQHLEALAHYDFLLGRVREKHPGVKTLKVYVGRLNGGLVS